MANGRNIYFSVDGKNDLFSSHCMTAVVLFILLSTSALIWAACPPPLHGWHAVAENIMRAACVIITEFPIQCFYYPCSHAFTRIAIERKFSRILRTFKQISNIGFIIFCSLIINITV
jgi:hypothetical protein